jgi:hypothetical protein
MEWSTDMSTPNSSDSLPRTRQARAAARRELDQLHREARDGLRAVRREGGTAAIVAGSKLLGIGVRGINRLAAGLRDGR